MASSKHSLVEYLTAMRNGQIQDAVDILTTIITNTPAAEKDDLITCIQYRLYALYELEQYENVLNDCCKLEELGVKIDDDPGRISTVVNGRE